VHGAALAPIAPPLLALAVWLVYSADRLLDSYRLQGVRTPTVRHAFVAARRTTLVRTWVGVLAAALTLALLGLDRGTLLLGLALTAGAGLYLLPLHLPQPPGGEASPRVGGALGRTLRQREVQHLQVGLLFAASVALFARHDLDPSWLPSLLLFAALCALNCAFIAAWEHRIDDGRRPPSRRAPRRAALALAATALASAALLGDPLPAAAALSTLALLALDRGRRAIEPSLLRTLADGVLIVPLLLIPLW
jgi:hypothetical protein